MDLLRVFKTPGGFQIQSQLGDRVLDVERYDSLIDTARNVLNTLDTNTAAKYVCFDRDVSAELLRTLIAVFRPRVTKADPPDYDTTGLRI